MKSKIWLLLFAAPFVFTACGDDSSTGGNSENHSANSSDSSNKDDKNENTPVSPEDIDWILPTDPSNLWDGEGTESKPYKLTSAEDLALLADEVNEKVVNFKGIHFKLTEDVTLSGKWTPIGCVKGQSNRTFGGVFDGGDKIIKGLNIDDTASVSGFFGFVSGGTIKNLNIEGAKIKAGNYAGMLFGKAENAEIKDCSVSGELNGSDFVGGLGGSVSGSKVENVTVGGSVQGNGSVGGVAATLISSSFKNVDNSASVSGKTTVAGIVSTLSMNSVLELCVNTGAVSGSQDVAGVVSKASKTEVKQSGNEGTVTAEDNSKSSVGGVVAIASNSAVLSQVYNTGTIKAGSAIGVGGIAGKFITDASMTSAFNHGQITAGSAAVGGIIGKAEVCVVKGAYDAGVVPNVDRSAPIAGEMQSASVMSDIYYDAGLQTSDFVEGTPEEDLKSSDFLGKLNAVEKVWENSSDYAGFPVFTWMK